ncbi:helix-turn-helix domain-containing protein [Microcystis wesenbergii]|uniref:IS630 transposase-related protein n=2 Tax=Microcystis wesenbergii TaxID=44823 RepID=A0ABU3HKX3_9CHRO|nr:IS630 transposase-related protein [Microcystis wesenbergii]MDT3675195.1 IS630 transposase-related protein [Microcystis wesenbergii NRERC-220]
MAAPYSDDLRQKAVSAVERGEKKSHVCRTLNISRNTLDIWLKRKKQTGTVAAKTNYRRGPKPQIDDLEAFQKLAEQYGHLTQEKMAQKWANPVSRMRIGQALKRIGFTRKKGVADLRYEFSFVGFLKPRPKLTFGWVQDCHSYLDSATPKKKT